MLRVSVPRAAAVMFVLSLGVAAPLLAQEVPPGDPDASSRPLQDAIAEAVAADAAAGAPAVPAAAAGHRRRPSALVPLYISFGVLQALDFDSTSRAIARGGTEANPALKGIVSNRAAFIGVKAAGTAGVIFASEKLWKKNRLAAILFMTAANSGMAWVVQHNYRAGK